MPPPWVVHDLHPYDGFWRQGGGESLKQLWWGWWERQGFGEHRRVAYFRRWPVPARWLPFLIETAALGFGGWAEFDRDWSDPRWLEQ